MSSLLSVKNMSINFDTPRGSLEAVRGVDIEIPAGTSVGVVGESGSGKTVMCRAAMGLLQGSNVKRSGTVIFDGHEITAMSKEEVRNLFGSGMAMIFQDPMTALNPVRRIGSQLSEGLRLRLGMSKADALARSKELLELVRIPNAAAILKSFPYQLSGGMRQRVMIAIAIACNPKLLFADMRMPYTEALLESIPKVDHKSGTRLAVIEGRLPNPTDRGAGCSFAPRCKYVQEKCHKEHPELKTDSDGHIYRCWFPIGEAK